MDSGIYIITNIANEKVYIGKSINLKNRLWQHKTNLRGNYHGNRHLQNAWNKYGEQSFTFEILEYCEIDILGIREKHFVKCFDATNRLKGYNNDEPTEDGGKIVSLETRKKISEASLGKKKKPFTKLHIKHISESPKRATPFHLLSPTGASVKGSNIKKFASQNGLHAGNLSAVIRGERKSHKGWKKV